MSWLSNCLSLKQFTKMAITYHKTTNSWNTCHCVSDSWTSTLRKLLVLGHDFRFHRFWWSTIACSSPRDRRGTRSGRSRCRWTERRTSYRCPDLQLSGILKKRMFHFDWKPLLWNFILFHFWKWYEKFLYFCS